MSKKAATGRLINRTKQTVIAERLFVADTFFGRLKGLLGTSGLPSGDALMIRPCNNIHMFGMRYAIDVAFVSADDKVLKAVEALAPGRIAWRRGAAYVVELPCGALRQSATETGDMLVVEKFAPVIKYDDNGKEAPAFEQGLSAKNASFECHEGISGRAGCAFSHAWTQNGTGRAGKSETFAGGGRTVNGSDVHSRLRGSF